MICVFDVIEGPARGKRFWLRDNQRIAVGRISTADFPVPADPHMSRHHLIFEASPKVIRVRDVGSANGTFVNNSRVSNLELCPGDHVRAGSTTFEVTMLSDDQDPHAKDNIPLDTFSSAAMNNALRGVPAATDQPMLPVPSTTGVEPLAAPAAAGEPGLETDGNRTGSVVYTESVAAALPQINPPQATLNPLGVSTRVLQFESQDLLPPEMRPSPPPTDDVMTMRSEPQWWSPYFQISSTAYMLEQRKATRLDLAETLKRAQAASPLALVVNVSQLGEAATQIYSTTLNQKLITRLSRTLSLVHCDDSDNLWNFVRKSARQDAIVCLASKHKFEAAWLVELLDCLSYPSMLSSLLASGNSRVQKRLLKYAEFAIFEKNRTGELALLIDL